MSVFFFIGSVSVLKMIKTKQNRLQGEPMKDQSKVYNPNRRRGQFITAQDKAFTDVLAYWTCPLVAGPGILCNKFISQELTAAPR